MEITQEKLPEGFILLPKGSKVVMQANTQNNELTKGALEAMCAESSVAVRQGNIVAFTLPEPVIENAYAGGTLAQGTLPADLVVVGPAEGEDPLAVGESSDAVTPKPISRMNLSELQAECTARGIEFDPEAPKVDLVLLLKPEPKAE